MHNYNATCVQSERPFCIFHFTWKRFVTLAPSIFAILMGYVKLPMAMKRQNISRPSIIMALLHYYFNIAYHFFEGKKKKERNNSSNSNYITDMNPGALIKLKSPSDTEI